ERSELIRKAGHRASDARPAGVHTAADVVDRAARGDVAIDHRPPAPDLDETLRIAVLFRVRPLLVVRAAHAVAVNRLAEEPGGPTELVELRPRPESLQEVEDRGHGLGEVVTDRRASRNIHDRDAERAPVVLAEKIHQAHRAGRVPVSRGNAAPGVTGAD